MKDLAVVFDLGKVLLDFDFQIFARRLADASPLSEKAVMEKVIHSKLLADYECGRFSSMEFFDRVKHLTMHRLGFADFAASFGEIFSEIPEMIATQAALQKAGIARYIFSNTNEIAIQSIRARFPFFAHFDGYIYSYEHGTMKPDPRLYEVVEKVVKQSSGKGSASLVFMDDKSENIETAKARGWKTILHTNPASTRIALKELDFCESL